MAESENSHCNWRCTLQRILPVNQVSEAFSLGLRLASCKKEPLWQMSYALLILSLNCKQEAWLDFQGPQQPVSLLMTAGITYSTLGSQLLPTS